MEAVVLIGTLAYSSVVTPSVRTQALLCSLAGLLGIFDAAYMHQPRSGVLACIAFAIPLVLPTGEMVDTESGPSLMPSVAHAPPSLPFVAAYASLVAVALIVTVVTARPRRPEGQQPPTPRMSRHTHEQQLAESTAPSDLPIPTAQSSPSPPAAANESFRRRDVRSRLVSEAEKPVSASGSKPRQPSLRQPRKQTDSQRVAAELYAASVNEARHAAAAAAAREEAAAAEIAAKRRKRDAALARRTQLQDAVRAAAAAVGAAKKALVAAMDEARVAGEKRARAGSQARAAPGDASAEAELNKCIADAATAEQKQQVALDDVTAASARLTDLRQEVSRLPSVPHLLDDID